MNLFDEESFNFDKVIKQKIDNVFYYYDEPKLYSCTMGLEERYIVVESMENSKQQIWLYVRINEDTYKELLMGKITFYHVFRNSLDGFIYKVTIFANVEHTINKIKSNDIQDELLPDKSSRVPIEKTNCSSHG